MKVLYTNGKRNGYDKEQCGRTLTVSELIEVLSDYSGDLPVYLINDGGYTYGSITEEDIDGSEESEE